LAVRCFLDAILRSREKGIDDFDTVRILESAFNRLFLAVEHLSNAMVLREEGNYSKKHFGDFNKLKDFKEKYGIDLAKSYQTTYRFRSYADYRKFPEIEDTFDMKHLHEQIGVIKALVISCLNLFKEEDFKELISLFNARMSTIQDDNHK